MENSSETSRERYKKSWTEDEDNLLRHFIRTYGKNWKKVTSFLPEKTSIQCRKRWNYTLNPEIKKSNWTITEDQILLSNQKKLGNKWSSIVNHLPGRVADDAKNRFAAIKRVENGTQKRYPKVSDNNVNNNILNHDVESPVSMVHESHVTFVDDATANTGDVHSSYASSVYSSNGSCMASTSGDTDTDDFSSVHSINNNSDNHTLEVERTYGSLQHFSFQPYQYASLSPYFNVPQQIILTAASLNYHNETSVKSTNTIPSNNNDPLLYFPPALIQNDIDDDYDFDEDFFELFGHEYDNDGLNLFQDDNNIVPL